MNPLSGQALTLFATHQPVQERVRRLEAMSRQSQRGRTETRSWA